MKSPTTLKLTDFDLSYTKLTGRLFAGGSTPETPMPLFDSNPSLQTMDSPPLTPGTGSMDRTITRNSGQLPIRNHAMGHVLPFQNFLDHPPLEESRRTATPPVHPTLEGEQEPGQQVPSDTLVTRLDELQGLFSDLTAWADTLQRRINDRRNGRGNP